MSVKIWMEAVTACLTFKQPTFTYANAQ